MRSVWRCATPIARLAGASVIFTTVASGGGGEEAGGSGSHGNVTLPRWAVGTNGKHPAAEYRYVIAGDGAAARAAAEVLAHDDPSGTLLIVAPWWDGPPPGAEDGTTQLAIGQRLLGVDPATRTATITGGHAVQYERAMLLAVGGDTPMPPTGTVLSDEAVRAGVVSGARTAGDRARIALALQAAAAPHPAHFTVVGGGWVGVATAASLVAHGADITFVYAEPSLLARHVPKYLSAEVRRRLRHTSQNGVDYLAYAGIRHVRVDNQTGEADVYAGVVFDPLSDVVFRTDHIVLAPTQPLPGGIQADALELRDGAYYTNRELAAATGVYAAGACASAPGGTNTRWARAHAEASGTHAARNMMGERQPYTPPRYADVSLDAIRTRVRVVERADAACESLGYFAVGKDAGDATCGGTLRKGILFYIVQEPQKNSPMFLFRVAGALLWDGVLGEDVDIHDDELLAETLALIDMEPCERGPLENKLDEFARTRFGVARGMEQRVPSVGRVLWRRHTAARTVPLLEDEVLWLENTRPGEFRSAPAEKADAYADLLRRSAGVK